MRILITGATGFVGSHLMEFLRQDGRRELHGLSRGSSAPVDRMASRDSIHFHAVDLERPEEVGDVLKSVQPDWLFHLAGYANTGKSFREPAQAWAGNLQATLVLYEAIARIGLRTRVIFTSSGLVYGSPSNGDHLCSETDPLNPSSPYASSKAAADLLSYQVTCHPGLDVVRVRCFNQIGPRQSPDYATANFARQIAAIEKEQQPPVLETGDLSGRRDLTDVRDMVRAFVLLAEKGKRGEAYNAGSGVAHSMQTVLERMLAKARKPIEVRQRFDPLRKAESAVSRANIQKLTNATNWTPRYSLDHSLADLLEYWRNKE